MRKTIGRAEAGSREYRAVSTGAAIAVTKAIPDLAGKFDGIAMRVPVTAGSIADITFVAKRNTTAEEVNKILTKAAKDKRWSKVFSVTNEPVVSSDIVGSKYASIADLSFTRVVGGPRTCSGQAISSKCSRGMITKWDTRTRSWSMLLRAENTSGDRH